MTQSPVISDETIKRLQDRAQQDGCSVDDLINNLLNETHQTLPYLTIALNNIADAVIATDVDLKITSWNQGAENIYGWTESEAIGKVIDDLLNTVWINEDQDEAQADLLQTGHWDGEIEQTDRHGQKHAIWAVVSFITDHDNAIIGAVAVNRDITKNKAIQEAFRTSEKRLKTLYSAIPDLIFRNRVDGTYLDYHALDNVELYISPSEFMGKTVSEIFPESLANDVMPVIEHVVKTGELTVYEYELESRFFEMRIVKSGTDEVLSIVRDITDSRLARKRELEFALERERLELLTRFIVNIAHEFRTPLSTIMTNAYLISRYDDSERIAQRTQQIDVQVNRISRLVDMSLMIAKLEDPTAPFSIIDIHEMVNGLSKVMHVHYGDTPQLKLDLCAGSPKVSGNLDYLVDAIQHLLDNAYHFTPADGAIKVSTQVINHKVIITIHDTGAGLSSDDLPRVFETFWRKDTAHSTPGFGLGLPIAKKVIEQHNGQIDIESEPGDGTTVHITLPLLRLDK